MGDILDSVKAKPMDRWQKTIGQVLVNIYMGDLSHPNFDELTQFVNDNFFDSKTNQMLTNGIDEVWDTYLKNGKDPNGSDSPKWRIYNEFEDSTPKRRRGS